MDNNIANIYQNILNYVIITFHSVKSRKKLSISFISPGFKILGSLNTLSPNLKNQQHVWWAHRIPLFKITFELELCNATTMPSYCSLSRLKFILDHLSQRKMFGWLAQTRYPCAAVYLTFWRPDARPKDYLHDTNESHGRIFHQHLWETCIINNGGFVENAAADFSTI